MRRTIALLLALTALAALAAPAAGARPLKLLLAPVAKCPGATDLKAPVAVQERAMRCLTVFARRRDGKSGISNDRALDRSALHKSGDILRCNSFSHYACGRAFTYWMQRVGYLRARCWRAGENIAWGMGQGSSARSIFNLWLHSPVHRENILGPYAQLGVGLRVGGLAGHSNAHVWVQHFGSHCGRPVPHFRRGLDQAVAVSPSS